VNAMKQIIMVRIFLILLYSFFGFQPYFYDSTRSIFILHRLEVTAKSPQYQRRSHQTALSLLQWLQVVLVLQI